MTQTRETRYEARPLRRLREGRIVAGVAIGLAHRLSIPANLIRLAFAIFTFVGGFGLALYVSGWLLIPEEGEDRPLASRLLSRVDSVSAWIGVGLVAVAVMAIADGVGFLRGDLIAAAVLLVVGVLLYRGDLGGRGSANRPTGPEGSDVEHAAGTAPGLGPTPPAGSLPPPPPAGSGAEPAGTAAPPPPAPPPQSILGRLTLGTAVLAIGVMGLAEVLVDRFEPGGRHYLGLAVGIVGIGLLVGTFVGRARGLIVLGALLVPLLLISPLTELDVPLSVDQRVHSPETVAEIEPDYGLGIGSMVIDLTGVPFRGETVTLVATVGMGELVIRLPEQVGVEAEARAGMGEVRLFGRERAGVGVRSSRTLPGEAGTVVIDASVDMGEVRISRSGVGPEERTVLDIEVDDPADLLSEYRVPEGSVTLDLSDLELQALRSVKVEVGTGDARVILPDEITTAVSGRVGEGHLEMLGRTQQGSDLLQATTVGADDVLLRLDIDVADGDLIVEGGLR